MLDKVNIDWEEFRERVRLCPACKRKKAAGAVGLVAAMKN
jgi:uracil-DNA glycosylase